MMDVDFYKDYTLEGFLGDDHLIKWVKYPDEENSEFWIAVLNAFPDQRGNIEEAADVIRILNKQVQPDTTALAQRVWQNIEGDLQLKYNYQTRRVLKMWTRIAASVLLILGFGFGAYYLQQNSMKVFHADYGALRSLTLPDGSDVVLNSNSEISYPQKWHNGKSRELWMKGEALFSVKHIARKNIISEADSFRVHVGNLRITVLGTQFNIKNRRSTTDILLTRGKIRIDFNDQSHRPVYMAPGESVHYDSVANRLDHINATTEAATAWTQRKLVLQGEALSDIIHVLEDNYGYQVVLKDPALAKRQLKGTIPLNKKADLLFVIRKVFNVNIEQRDNTLIIY
ncbi:ferric-dicitrate binding protein FerR, regulates iron transport through sigma-19 [Mucilaginibacter gossypiicola]|uniref:Ferric-dicitrate binding protein FerR, regulates iron transport through sigma-19 n=1 Tax=Mucilaginibacter gossypiicola TaxID=551995 RepID=A0A1H8LMY1_9SPHI|nr:FecR domain-containing protein [Mucilaginibacter gossypiicola]SEO06188.1 ferric-dicitrate binding protein FerR, regulates iron transport through sigma-19 [Mucilaginibacter gossypiicola]